MTDASSPDQAEATKAPTAPQNWVERWRRNLQRWPLLLRLYDRWALPVASPSDFTQGDDELAQQLMPSTGDETSDAVRAAEILAEAQAIYGRAEERASSAEGRATTLQGAVAIAASLLLAGAAFVVGGTELRSADWRYAFAVVLFGATVALVMCGVRALSATSTIHARHVPAAANIVDRSQVPRTEARVRLAAETLVDYSYNTKIAAWKVAYLGAAAWWFRIALAFLVVLALLVAAYAVAGPPPLSSTGTSRHVAPVFGRGRAHWGYEVSGRSGSTSLHHGRRANQ